MWIRNNNRPVSPYDIVELFGKSYMKVRTGETAANGDGCTTNITPLESRAETRQVQTEIPVPEITVNVQPEPAPSTSGLNRSSLDLVSPHAISPAPEIRRRISNRGIKAAVAKVITFLLYKNVSVKYKYE
ncbi:hypothetical protein WA026_022038 [Henosepilachna vigintioctopunctata]|uniref:Uncharacterized protein n=1 Tax=Henosepilachna vigintioctopunctata TaxID=420089 RepID=A0AAW1V1Y5_9CUCU